MRFAPTFGLGECRFALRRLRGTRIRALRLLSPDHGLASAKVAFPTRECNQSFHSYRPLIQPLCLRYTLYTIHYIHYITHNRFYMVLHSFFNRGSPAHLRSSRALALARGS